MKGNTSRPRKKEPRKKGPFKRSATNNSDASDGIQHSTVEPEFIGEQDRAHLETLKIPADDKRSGKNPSTKNPSASKRPKKDSAAPTKDPSKPKRPLSGSMAYSNARRAILKREMPHASNAQLSKELAKNFNSLPTLEQAVYDNEAVEANAQYKREMATWKSKKTGFDAPD